MAVAAWRGSTPAPPSAAAAASASVAAAHRVGGEGLVEVCIVQLLDHAGLAGRPSRRHAGRAEEAAPQRRRCRGSVHTPREGPSSTRPLLKGAAQSCVCSARLDETRRRRARVHARFRVGSITSF